MAKNKRIVVDCDKEFHSDIKSHCAKTEQKMKDFCREAIEEKYEKEKNN